MQTVDKERLPLPRLVNLSCSYLEADIRGTVLIWILLAAVCWMATISTLLANIMVTIAQYGIPIQ